MEEEVGDKLESSVGNSDEIGNNRLKKYINCCSRLHHVLHLINSDTIHGEELISNLSETLNMMEEVASDPKFLDEDESEDSETNVVPAEIKDWLASTFTNSSKYVRKSERPRFRAVAKAVLAMIMVEKIFKKSNENASLKIPQAVTKMMDIGINAWEFNIFNLNELSDGYGLKNLTMYLFLHHNILRKYKISVDCLEMFLDVLQEGYAKNGNPFFNSLHAADVMQTIHYFIHNFKLNVWFTDLQTFTLLFSALIHDYDHRGVSNQFLIKTKDELALIYNDIHVRENHHVSSVFRVLHQPEYNFLRAMFKNDFNEFRKMTVECVLDMDLTQHFHQMKHIKSELTVSEELDKSKVMSFLLHVADLSFVAKETKLHIKWINMLNEQYYKQGDMEYKLNLPYSPLCNRNENIKLEAINSLFTYITEPLFDLFAELLQEIDKQNTFVLRPTAQDTFAFGLAKKYSNNALGRLYAWQNLLVLNKSVWQRRHLFKNKSTLQDI